MLYWRWQHHGLLDKKPIKYPTRAISCVYKLTHTPYFTYSHLAYISEFTYVVTTIVLQVQIFHLNGVFYSQKYSLSFSKKGFVVQKTFASGTLNHSEEFAPFEYGWIDELKIMYISPWSQYLPGILSKINSA